MTEPARNLALSLPNSNVRPQGLATVRDLFARLHEANLAYCQWKSNEHLGAAVEGQTDLDVLVDPTRVAELQSILAGSGFKRFAATPLRAYPGIEDYLGFDSETGHLTHLHLHYQLTLGESHLKGYRLPWEHRVLATRRRDPVYGVDVADPTIELILLIVRAALKLRTRHRFRRTGAGDDFLRELEWLRARTEEDQVCEVVSELVGPMLVAPFRRVLGEPTSARRLRAFAAVARKALRRHRTFGRAEGRMRAWLREAQWIADAVNRRYVHRATPFRRVSPRGGSVIVLIGADGSGKSTLAHMLVEWLGVKLDAMPLYFGSGDGPSAWYRGPLKWAHGILKSRMAEAPHPRSPQAAGCTPGWLRFWRAAARIPWALALSCEKRGKVRRMMSARNRGMIVVCDRYPQSQVSGFNDGPLLAHWRDHPNRIFRTLSAWEAEPYVDISRNPPDLVIKVTVAPDVALARRPDMSLEQTIQRMRTVRGLVFPASTRVVDLDGNAPLDAVARAVKRLVWEVI